MKKNFIIVCVILIIILIVLVLAMEKNGSFAYLDTNTNTGTYDCDNYSFSWAPDEYKFKMKAGCPVLEKKDEGVVYSFAVIGYTNLVTPSDETELIEYGIDKLKAFYKKYPVDIGHVYAYDTYPELYPDREYTTVVRGGFGSSGFDKMGFHHEMYIIQDNRKTLVIAIGFDGSNADVEDKNLSFGEFGVIDYFRPILDSVVIK